LLHHKLVLKDINDLVHQDLLILQNLDQLICMFGDVKILLWWKRRWVCICSWVEQLKSNSRGNIPTHCLWQSAWAWGKFLVGCACTTRQPFPRTAHACCSSPPVPWRLWILLMC
jgi:hypothetical protein